MTRFGHLVLLGAALCPCGCAVRTPSAFESQTIIFVKHHITVRNKATPNPIVLSVDNLETGKEGFGHYCIACHGKDGQNTGVPFAASMGPPLPLLTSPEVQAYTDGQLKWVIDSGLWPSGMPASRGTLSDDDQWSIVLYLRHLPPPGSVGEPDLYTH